MARSANLEPFHAYIQATYVSRGEAEHILEAFCWAQQGRLQQALQEHDALVGAFVAARTPEGFRLLQITCSKPVCDVSGCLDLQATLLTCGDGSSQLNLTLSGGQLLDQLPPTDDGAEAAEDADDSLLSLLPCPADEQQMHVNHCTWRQAVQQLHQSAQAGDMSGCMSSQQVLVTMLRLILFSELHRRLKPMQQLLAAHNVSLTVLRSLTAALQSCNGQQATPQQQTQDLRSLLNARQGKFKKHQQQQAHLAALRLVVPQLPDDALQTLLPHVEAVQALRISITPRCLQQLLSGVTGWQWRQHMELAHYGTDEHLHTHTAATSATGTPAAPAAAVSGVDHASPSAADRFLAAAPAGPDTDMVDTITSPAAGRSKRTADEPPAAAAASKKQRMDTSSPPPPAAPATAVPHGSDARVATVLKSPTGAALGGSTSSAAAEPSAPTVSLLLTGVQPDQGKQPAIRTAAAGETAGRVTQRHIAASNTEQRRVGATSNQKPAGMRPLSSVAARRAPLAQPIRITLAADQPGNVGDDSKQPVKAAATHPSAIAAAEGTASTQADGMQAQVPSPKKRQLQHRSSTAAQFGTAQQTAACAVDVNEPHAAAERAITLNHPAAHQHQTAEHHPGAIDKSLNVTVDARFAGDKSLPLAHTSAAAAPVDDAMADQQIRDPRRSTELCSDHSNRQAMQLQKHRSSQQAAVLKDRKPLSKPSKVDKPASGNSAADRAQTKPAANTGIGKGSPLQPQHPGGVKSAAPSSTDEYLLEQFDRLQLAVSSMEKSQRAVVQHDKLGTLLDLRWYLKVEQNVQQQPQDEHKVLRFLKQYPKVFRVKEQSGGTKGAAAVVYCGLQPGAQDWMKQQLTAGHQFKSMLRRYKEKWKAAIADAACDAAGQGLQGILLDAAKRMVPKLQPYIELYPSFAVFAEELLRDEFKVTSCREGQHHMLTLRHPPAAAPHKYESQQHRGSTHPHQQQEHSSPPEDDQHFATTTQHGSEWPHQQHHPAPPVTSPIVSSVAAEHLTPQQLSVSNKLLADARFVELLAHFKNNLKRRLLEVLETQGVQGIALQEVGNPQARPQIMTPELYEYQYQFRSLTSFLQVLLGDEFVMREVPGHHDTLILWQPKHYAYDVEQQPATLLKPESNQQAARSAVQQLLCQQQSPAGQAQQHGVESEGLVADDCLGHSVSSSVSAVGASAADVEHKPLQALQSVWDRLGPSSNAPVSPTSAAAVKRVGSGLWRRHLSDKVTDSKPAATAAEARRSVHDTISDLPAIFRRLSAPADVSKPPAKPIEVTHQISLPSDISSELADELDLALIQTLLQHIRRAKTAEGQGSSQAQSLEEGELAADCESQLVDGTAADDQHVIRELPQHWMPAMEFVHNLRQVKPMTQEQDMLVSDWLHYLCVSMVVQARTSEAADSVANGAADVSIKLEVPRMLDRLMKHRLIKELLHEVEEVLIAEMCVGARHANEVKVPRLEVEAANKVLRDKVPRLRPYLLLPGSLPALIRSTQLQDSFVIGHSLSPSLSTSNLVLVELRPSAAAKHGLCLRLCHGMEYNGHCRHGDYCWFSHAKLA